METIKLSNENFEREVLDAEETVLIDFWAAWCGPCRMLSPIIEEVAAEVSNAKICKVNVDEEPELAERFSVMSIPTLIVMRDGEIVNSSVGVKPKQAVLALLEK